MWQRTPNQTQQSGQISPSAHFCPHSALYLLHMISSVTEGYVCGYPFDWKCQLAQQINSSPSCSFLLYPVVQWSSFPQHFAIRWEEEEAECFLLITSDQLFYFKWLARLYFHCRWAPNLELTFEMTWSPFWMGEMSGSVKFHNSAAAHVSQG